MHLGQMAINVNLLCQCHLSICHSLEDQEAITWKGAMPRHIDIKNDGNFTFVKWQSSIFDEEQDSSLKKRKEHGKQVAVNFHQLYP